MAKTTKGSASVSPAGAGVGVVGQGLPRRRFFSDMPDKGLFGIVAFAGFAGIMALKLSDYDADYIAALAVAVMIAYGMLAFRIPAVQLRLDRLGDNFYYLGFIYTLASLSAALLQLRGGTQIEVLLGSFGIALVTTIVGIAGRVLLVQMRGELDEVEDRVRRDLAKAAADLRAELTQALREFETFRKAVAQSTEEMATQSTDAGKQQIERIANVAESAANRIHGAFDANRAQAQRLGQAVDTISSAAEQLSARLARMELPSERLETQIAAFGKNLEALLLRLAVTVDDVARRAVPKRRWFWPFWR